MSQTLTAERVAPAPEQARAEAHKPPTRRVLMIGGLAGAGLVVALVAGTLPRLRQQQQVSAAAAAAASAPPRVNVAVARPVKGAAERVLPGNSLPLLNAAIYARTTGYLKTRLVDIGDQVKEGQLLAEIATPEIDAQLQQSRATLLQSKATLSKNKADALYAQQEVARVHRLLGPGTATMEEYQSRVAAAESSRAMVRATEALIKVNEADVLRLETLVSFQKLKAPFPGTITAKHVDPGALVSADSPNTTRELFHLMRTDVLRVMVNVPQVFATDVKVGQEAIVFRPQEPQKTFKGTVTRTADALDPSTRTLLAEVQVKNPDNALRPGMYLQARFVFDRAYAPVVIPSVALATRTGPPRVAVLDGQHRVRYRTVELGRDFGAEIMVLGGLKAGETVIVHPGDDLPEGLVVEPIPIPRERR